MLPGEALSLHFQVLQFEQTNKVQQKKNFQANNELQASWLISVVLRRYQIHSDKGLKFYKTSA